MEELNQVNDVIDDPFFRKLAWRASGFFVFMVLGTSLLSHFFKDQVSSLALMTVEALGLPGIIAGVLISDALGFPVPTPTYLFAAVAAGAPVLALLTIVATTSALSGSLAYFLGPWLGKLPLFKQFLERFRPLGELLIRRWGVWAIGVAAITPLPFSILCWLAGIYRMPFRRFFAATLIRAPSIVVYYVLFALGWTTI